MEKLIMTRSASDNTYLHKDFHGALSTGIDYLEANYGADAVQEFLRRFTNSYYAPVKADLKERGLIALKEHFEKVYGIEGGSISIDLTEDTLVLKVEACPALAHMRENGMKVASLFFETDRTVDDALCEGTPYAAEFIAYEEETGRSIRKFFRRGQS